MARSKSSNQWMQEHLNDEYVKKAKELGYRSRATFKLIEIIEKDKLVRTGMNVVDLGAAPGGWSEYVRGIVGKKQKVIALDILDIEPIEGVDFIQGDFREDKVFEQLNEILDGAPIDVVLSDMAPNLSGNKAIDQPSAMYLCELALETAVAVLVDGGTFLVKVFQGTGFDEYKKQVASSFDKVLIRKPKSSRARSNEVYILAKGFKKQ
ncbi:23S rRNA (uridine2552-2'-O)-methyltransferase [Bathymodiolus platifrons methanotrophic gill symbiont]|uniref:23S rRNA (uridine(2552)-2'-O)-methyltransferase RlmE n=1 Tax=Bathymodiolus platifrons methanotrophic gill symbiont TaxID=113268 RepID=UPI000B41C1F6|nr:23S rRNA (uridine(2552)-2'-O)-methyltransferase RlmE [Bathymodiolus platifrons methanotrophic gill symbiont]MCK5870800.1 23S rRNA (uridine(2552)-2'-O)-methyltransferase RlmE [Methyloprofundus sp.]TXK98121.1 23S rRNA (uridine(2552)-2'-O)-methyltransferase [Methylococcaceae bacterium CS4]TXK99631.1 23S rRNA (uridine(2552)-2'-O)-methyltransferase [Methylococcaceae bacterium CS5]TXL05288.1 23S rRNA (uridine(2552)-2'-O)-methyltransferase [Methylococcaceae bacterium CS1]TXL08000.1 23S rRNA (uridi